MENDNNLAGEQPTMPVSPEVQQDNNASNDAQPVAPATPQDTKKAGSKKAVLIIGGIAVIVLAAVAVGVYAFVFNKPAADETKNEEPIASEEVDDLDFSACKHRAKDAVSKTAENITKADAIKAFKDINGEEKCTPEGYIPEKLELRADESSRTMLYSYDDPSEVIGIAQESVMGLNVKSADDFQIEETTDYYTIVSVKDANVACGEMDEHYNEITCYRGIAFNKKYVDYHEETVGISNEDVYTFNDMSAEFVELFLKVYMATNMSSGGRSVFDYYFEEKDDAFELTGIFLGIGMDTSNLWNMTSAEDISYVFNIYGSTLILDKSTGEMSWEKYESDLGGESRMNILKSYSLTDEDIEELRDVLADETDVYN